MLKLYKKKWIFKCQNIYYAIRRDFPTGLVIKIQDSTISEEFLGKSKINIICLRWTTRKIVRTFSPRNIFLWMNQFTKLFHLVTWIRKPQSPSYALFWLVCLKEQNFVQLLFHRCLLYFYLHILLAKYLDMKDEKNKGFCH